MTTLDELFQTEAGLRVQQASYRKALLEAMAHKVAMDLKDESTRREIGVPVLAGFIKGIIPAGKGQAEKADDAANRMIDSILESLGVTEEVVTEAQAESPKTETEEQPKGKAKAA